MKKGNLYILFFVLAGLFFLAFAISFGVDAYYYKSSFTSFPLYAFAIVRAVEFILPSGIFFLVGIILKRKFSKKK